MAFTKKYFWLEEILSNNTVAREDSYLFNMRVFARTHSTLMDKPLEKQYRRSGKQQVRQLEWW